MTKAHQAIYSRLFAHFLWWAHFEATVPIKLWLSLLQRPCSNCDFKIEGIKGIVGRVGKLASCRNPCCHVSRCVPFSYQRLFLWDLERLWLLSEENKKQKNKKQTNTQFNTDKTLLWTTCTFSILRNNNLTQLFPMLMHSWKYIPDATAGRSDFKSACLINISLLGRSLLAADFVVDGDTDLLIKTQNLSCHCVSRRHPTPNQQPRIIAGNRLIFQNHSYCSTDVADNVAGWTVQFRDVFSSPPSGQWEYSGY